MLLQMEEIFKLLSAAAPTHSLPPPRASHRLLAGSDSWHLRHEECPADHFQQVFHGSFIKAVYCLSSAMPAGCS